MSAGCFSPVPNSTEGSDHFFETESLRAPPCCLFESQVGVKDKGNGWSWKSAPSRSCGLQRRGGSWAIRSEIYLCNGSIPGSLLQMGECRRFSWAAQGSFHSPGDQLVGKHRSCWKDVLLPSLRGVVWGMGDGSEARTCILFSQYILMRC